MNAPELLQVDALIRLPGAKNKQTEGAYSLTNVLRILQNIFSFLGRCSNRLVLGNVSTAIHFGAAYSQWGTFSQQRIDYTGKIYQYMCKITLNQGLSKIAK